MTLRVIFIALFTITLAPLTSDVNDERGTVRACFIYDDKTYSKREILVLRLVQ